MPYTTISSAKDAGFPTSAEGVPLTIAQINKLADIHDAVKEAGGAENPMAVAWTQWKKIFKKVGDNWELIEKGSEHKKFVDCFPISFSEVPIKKLMEVNVVPVGDWKHELYGKMKITENDIEEFVEHFDAGIRKGVPITEGHPKEDGKGNVEELPAIGWFKKLINKGSEGLWATIEWTKKGQELLKEKAYKYFSPEFYMSYEDPETHKIITNVLTGGALTNMPYFKDLKAIVASEAIFNQFNEGDKNMKLEDIKIKKVDDLTDEEKDFLKENVGELSDEEKETFKSVIEASDDDDKDKDDDDGDGDKDKDDDGDKDKDDDSDDDDDDKDKDVKASEGSVKISGAELKALQTKANAGEEALKQLTETKIKAIATKFQFSESNKDGKFLPKSKDKVVKFMLSLNKEQLEKFSELLTELPKVKLFGELGDLGTDKNAGQKFEEKIQAKMKEDDKMQYSDALRVVSREDPELAKEYEEENK